MRKIILFFTLMLSAAGAVLTTSATAQAAELKTIILSVDKMTCNMCPITVKKALRKVDGVREVSAEYEGDGKGWAKVTYDPSKVDVEGLIFATEQAGYPSRLQSSSP